MSNSFITNVNTLVDNLSAVYEANEKLTPEVINQLTALNLAQLQAVYAELAKIVDVQANMSSVVTTAGAIESIVTLANYLDAASAPTIVEDLILIHSKLDALTASVDFLTETITGLGSAQLAIESQTSPVFVDIPTVATIMPFNVVTPSSNTDIISTDALQDTITFKLNGSYTFTSNVSVTSRTNATVALSFKIVDIATGNVLATESNTVHINRNSTATLPLTTLLTIANAPVTVSVEAQSTASGYELTSFDSLLVSSVTVGLPDIYAERLYVVEKDSSTGAARLPAGNTASRPATAELGSIRYNTDINEYEGYTDSGWESLAAGATGSNGDNVFLVTDKVMTSDYTVPENKRAVAFGDVELVGDLTVPDTSELLVLGDYKDGMLVVSDISKLSTVNTSVATNVAVKSYHNGLEGGGGVFYYDSTKPRTEHNGGTVIAPNALFPSDWNNQVQLATWFDGSSLAGTGCWIRSYDGAVNVEWFGAKGDGVTDDTLSVKNSFKSKAQVEGKSGSTYYVSYIQASGSQIEVDHYIGSDVFTFNGNNCTFKQNGYVGSSVPNSGNLGLNYGFYASVFSLHGFSAVNIRNVKMIGPFFDNIIEDSKPYIAGVQGTDYAYNTLTKAISVNFSDNVNIENITTSKFYGSVYMRECNDSRVKNVFHKYSRHCYNFQDCTNLTVDNCVSYKALFSLDSQPGGTGNVDGKVYDRATNTLLYTIVENPTGRNGFKVTAGYGFVVAGCENTLISNCISEYSGSDCFRLQDGPTGNPHKGVVFKGCTSIGARRYAFSTRDGVNVGHFIECVAEGTPEFFDGVPPLTKEEALAGVGTNSVEDLLNYWAFKLPRDDSSYIYSTGMVLEGCTFNGKEDLRTWAEANKSQRYVYSFDLKGFVAAAQFYSKNTTMNNCSFSGQCRSNNGYFQLFGGNLFVKNSTISTYMGGDSTSTTDPYLVGIRGDMGDVVFENNTFTGGIHIFTKIVTSAVISSFISKNNRYTTHSSIFSRRLADTYFHLECEKDFFKAPRLFMTDSGTGKLGGVLFQDCVFKVDYETNRSWSDPLLCVLYKEGGEYYAWVSYGTTSVDGYSLSFHAPRTSIKIKEVARINPLYTATSLPATEGQLINTLFNADIESGVYKDVATIHENDAVTPKTFKLKVDQAGVGLQRFLAASTSAELSIAGIYKVSYSVLEKNYNDLAFIKLRA